MAPRFFALLSGTLLLGVLLITQATAQEEALPPPPPAAPTPQDGVDVMARGPVHEAYAEPTETRPQPSPLIEKQPPAPINELPPDQKPDGDNVQWIPGYWSWDQDQNDYLWVSGFWRTPPPGRQWMPGTWQQVEGGWHWVAGFWATAGQEEAQYLPTPPPTLDQGPSVPAPQANSSYVPGCWIHRESRYWWRPGFWVGYHPGWVWIPAHYVWTPAGCLFVEGYWDHPLEQRGLLFAPVRLAARLLGRPRWFYTPQYVVQPDFLMGALFVHPANRHYYFGDYFAARYQRAGFVPWIDYRIGRSVFDPNFAYYRHTYAGYGTWERGLRDLYTARIRGDIARPPITLVQQNQVIRNITVNKSVNVNVNRNINITNVQNVSVLTPLARVNNTRVTNLLALANVRGGEVRKPAIAEHVVRLQAVSAAQRAHEQKVVAQVHAVAQARQQSQARLLSEGPPIRVTDKPKQVKLNLSHIAGSPAARPPVERPVTPRPGEKPRPPVVKPVERPKPVIPPPARKVLPPTPPLPRHQDKPIPKYEAPRPPAPPKHVAPPRPAPPPKKEAPKKPY
ncbi:MAG TPA: hypothetical protein VN688_11260 [Gemmataceae bacterium]|nr:hypothetical protein [Gemmataceae bacterium]